MFFFHIFHEKRKDTYPITLYSYQNININEKNIRILILP